jgi:hypothetical protein
MIKRQISHSWALRTDPRLRPFIERIATEEVLRAADVVRILLIEGLERRGLLKRGDLAVDRQSADRRTGAAA